MSITSKDERAVRLAKKLMGKSKHPKYRYVSMVLKGSNMIGIGFNKQSKPKHFVKTLPGQKHHAEIDSLLWLNKDITKGCTLIVWGETNVGNFILSRPCKACYDIIKQHGIRRILFSDREGNIVEERIC